jgi:hypothetical protein
MAKKIPTVLPLKKPRACSFNPAPESAFVGYVSHKDEKGLDHNPSKMRVSLEPFDEADVWREGEADPGFPVFYAYGSRPESVEDFLHPSCFSDSAADARINFLGKYKLASLTVVEAIQAMALYKDKDEK